jgi:lactate dehydrogenase-like 2-hydroxyacid dehydrogenase
MTRVLRVGNLKADLSQELEGKYDALVLPTDETRAAFLAEHGPEVTAVVTSGRFGVDRALMDALPSLEVIVSYGVGYDTTDVAAAVERGIQISNTPDVLTDCVADTAVGLAIDVMRGLSAADRYVRRGAWPEQGDFPLTRRISKARVGILGLGRIGTAIATRLAGFGCQISYTSRREVAGSPYAFVDSPVALAAAVDLLVVSTSGGPASSKLVSREVLEALGPDGFLVNVARGSVVDEDALVDLLESGRLGGAGLDVFANEPHVPAQLLGRDDVVLLPHLASGTVETRADMRRLTVENLASWLNHGKLVTPIPEVLT